MNSTKKISFDIKVNTLKRLDEVSEIADRPRAYILNELLEDYLDELEGFYLAAARLKNTPESEYFSIVEERMRIPQKELPHGKGGKR